MISSQVFTHDFTWLTLKVVDKKYRLRWALDMLDQADYMFIRIRQSSHWLVNVCYRYQYPSSILLMLWDAERALMALAALVYPSWPGQS